MDAVIASARMSAQVTMTAPAAALRSAACVLAPDGDSALDLTVFVSCYNESQHIARTLDNVREALAEMGRLTYEIIVIDDCSTDESARVISQYVERHPDERIVFRRNLVNIGWAQNYIDAAFIGRGRYYRVVCGDESEPKETLLEVFRHLGEADILVPYYATAQGRSIYRLALSSLFTALVNLLSGFHLRYYNGLHVHLRYNVMRWHSNTRGFGFQADLLCLLLEQGFSYKEIAVTTIERKKGRSTALSVRNFLSVGHSLFDIFVRRIANRVHGVPRHGRSSQRGYRDAHRLVSTSKCVPSPLVGEGQGGGAQFDVNPLGSQPAVTPHPNPPPQGGREPQE